MKLLPTLETERLRLRPLTLEDAPAVHRLAGRREIADTTISIPHPCQESQVREWIARQARSLAEGSALCFAMELRHPPQLIGAIGLRDIDRVHEQAEMGFWVGVDWWGQGYATEAARGMLEFGFRQAGLNRIYAHHMVRNPASGRVLAKLGMTREGLLRQRVVKWGVYEDVVLWAMVRQDWPG